MNRWVINATVRKRPVAFQPRVHEVTRDAVARVKVAVLVCNVWHARVLVNIVGRHAFISISVVQT